MKTFDGRVAAITGAGSGIGEALALQLAQAGCHLALSDINSDMLESVANRVRKSGVTCTTHRVDVADRLAVEQYASEAQEAHGAVHMIFNNAGVALADYVETQTYEDFEHLMNINFWGVVYGTKSFLPYLRKVDDAHVVNISSLFGLFSLPSQSAYNAAKAAVRGFTESLKMELSPSHINVSCVHPGGVKTNIARNGKFVEENVKMSQAGFVKRFDSMAKTTSETAAKTILKGVLKNKRRILVGNDARFMDKIVRLFPGFYERIFNLEKPVHKRWSS